MRLYAVIGTLFLSTFFYVIYFTEPFSSIFDTLTFTGVHLSDLLSEFRSPWQNRERCNDNWVNLNTTALDTWLHTRLYGQHLASSIVSKSLKDHVKKMDPRKPLVMSFHGQTGCGKSLLSKIIANSLYRKGTSSKFVHMYFGSLDFPHENEVEKYRGRLRFEIPTFTKDCYQSMFIFDEVDKVVPGVIDAITPFLDFHSEINGTSYCKNIFIFLSNSGDKEITRTAFDFWLDGYHREEMTLKNIAPLIESGVLNERSALQHSEIVEKNLIDAYVPFLPLEKRHVKMCIARELKSRGIHYNESIIEAVDREISYQPPEFEIFSVSGCKKVSHKVDLYSDV